MIFIRDGRGRDQRSENFAPVKNPQRQARGGETGEGGCSVDERVGKHGFRNHDRVAVTGQIESAAVAAGLVSLAAEDQGDYHERREIGKAEPGNDPRPEGNFPEIQSCGRYAHFSVAIGAGSMSEKTWLSPPMAQTKR